jgi:serine-type D-Ala-D-Ala endopeptidase (penicillin-binding protein 7)
MSPSLLPSRALSIIVTLLLQGRSMRGVIRLSMSALLLIGLVLCSDAFAANQQQSSSRTSSSLQINSSSALIIDERGNRIYGKNTRQVKPIASITKLMTAMVVLDSGVSLDTPIRIIEQDRDRLRNSRSRLRIDQATLSRREMLMVMLISSDNRAAAAIARTTFPGGTPRFVDAMNRKAKSLGMTDTHFADSSGLDNRNRSTAEDLVKLIRGAGRYNFIRQATSRGEMTVYPFADHSPLEYRNTNPLVRSPEWTVEVSKTGFINESGHCLVMQTEIGGRRLYVVFLDAAGKLTPVGDSNRLRSWLGGGRRIAEN